MADRRTNSPSSTRSERLTDPGQPQKTEAPSEEEVVACLAGKSGKVDDATLKAMFGADLGELRKLAEANRRMRRRKGAAPKVYLLHGIMGSELGVQRRFWDDVIWLGLTDILMGNLRKLSLGAGGDSRIHALGFLPGVYLLMRLHLEDAGFEVVPHVFDWRRNLTDLGRELSQRIAGEKGRVMIVAHSMGGLVTRAAFRQGLRNVERFVMLAVPNHGSLAPVEALRGQYGLARLIARGDLVNNAKDLAEEVFRTFPGLYQMILDRRLHPGLDLFEASQWPSQGPRPDRQLLAAARGVDRLLAGPAETPDIPWHLIAGTGQPTKVAARMGDNEFEYLVTNEGDGTVPLASALLPGLASTFFARAGHGFFANDGKVRAATVDLLRRGGTMVLGSATPPVVRSRGEQWVRESDLRTVASSLAGRRAPGIMTHAQRLAVLFGEPSVVPARAADPVAAESPRRDLPRLEQVTVGRRKLRRLEVAFYRGSITDVSARAYVLGTFLGVTPSGAAGALDSLMDGAISELLGHNMFGSRTGEVFILPLAQREVRAEMGVFVGMGSYDKFKAAESPPPQAGSRGTRFHLHRQHVPALEIAAENAARMLARTKVDDFATVLLGGTVAEDLAASAESMLRGFLRGLEEADHGQGVRRLVFCETNEERFHAVRRQIVELASTPLCEGMEFVFSELDPPPEVERLRALGVSTSVARTTGPEPVYLLVRTEPAGGSGRQATTTWKASFLGPSNRAAVREEAVELAAGELDDLLAVVAGDGVPQPGEESELGRRIAERLLPKQILADLQAAVVERPLVILHDAEASKIPWETLGFSISRKEELVHPALAKGISRRFLADASVCARWATPSRRDGSIDVLLISNPTDDLAEAEKEAKKLREVLSADSRFRVDHSLCGAAATRGAILGKLASGRYDIVHYCGHAFFDPANRDACGLVCAQQEVLTGRDVAGIAKLPFLMVLNGCQSAKTRRGGKGPAKQKTAGRPVGWTAAAQTIAETMLCSGIANLVGTFWPVDDAGAQRFAVRFYQELLAGHALGVAVTVARKELHPGNSDWANYALFGNPMTRLGPEGF